MIIGNIVSKIELGISAPRINYVKDISEVDNKYPTLLVGYYDIKDNYDLNFIDRKISDNLFWTFNREEDRTKFGDDLYDFIVHCEQEFLADFKYYHIDPFKITKKTLKKILRHINKNGGCFLIDKDMLFVESKGVTFGIDLGICKVVGIQRVKILLRLKNSSLQPITKDVVEKIRLDLEDVEFDNAHIPYITQKIKK
jgi:hypothetical protein